MTGEPRRGAIVTNPGSRRWLHEMAGGLARAELLERYVTGLVGTDRMLRLAGSLPAPLSGAIGKEIAKRPRPRHVPDEAIAIRGAILEAGTTIFTRRFTRSPSATQRVTAAHRTAFDWIAAREVHAGSNAVLASSRAALRTLARARRLGIPAILDYPTAHHDAAGQLLSEERRLVPEFAATLQHDRLTRAERHRLDEEIAAADRILLLSSWSLKTFVAAGVAAEKLVVTPLGVDLDSFSPAPRRDDGTFRVLFAGQLTQRKGISYLLDAFHRAAVRDSELVFLGRPVGPVEWLRAPGVVHWPPVSILELRDRYVQADVYVLPSLLEGFPQTAILAMACGLPAIVTEHTFGSDVITDGEDGFVVPIRDADAIAERLRLLAADPSLRARMGVAARARAMRFTWEAYGERVVDVVRELG